jgi:hypothetical protein
LRPRARRAATDGRAAGPEAVAARADKVARLEGALHFNNLEEICLLASFRKGKPLIRRAPLMEVR